MSETIMEIVPGFYIRKAEDHDLDRAAKIASKAWEQIHESLTEIMGEPLHDTLCVNWEEKKENQIKQHALNHPNWMYVVDSKETGEVVAFVTFRVDEEASIGTIGNNAVTTDAQGYGIGTEMYKFVLGIFKEMGLNYASVTTGLDKGHAPARRSYEKAGFDRARENVTFYKYLQ